MECKSRNCPGASIQIADTVSNSAIYNAVIQVSKHQHIHNNYKLSDIQVQLLFTQLSLTFNQLQAIRHTGTVTVHTALIDIQSTTSY